LTWVAHRGFESAAWRGASLRTVGRTPAGAPWCAWARPEALTGSRGPKRTSNAAVVFMFIRRRHGRRAARRSQTAR
jgi:hypothetical protein